MVHVVDRNRFRPIETALHVISAVRSLWPRKFRWGPGNEATDPMKRFFDLLLGTDRVRKGIAAGRPVRSLTVSWAKQCAAFDRKRRQYLLYE